MQALLTHLCMARPALPFTLPTDLPGLPGVWAAVRYLVSLSEADIPLIRKHSTWIFRADPEAGLQVWTPKSMLSTAEAESAGCWLRPKATCLIAT